MSKIFYIVPSSNSYYETVITDTAEDALVIFSEGMADDMSAYFKAVDVSPVNYPHTYQYPEGRFRKAISVIVDTMTNNTGSAYYQENALNGMNLSHIYEILKAVTGFSDEILKVF